MSSRLNSQGMHVWDRNWGAVTDIGASLDTPMTAIPDGMVAYALNVQLRPSGVMYPRRGMTAASTTGTEPTVGIRYLFAERDGTVENLWAFASDGAAAMVLHVFDGTTWSAIGLSDTVATLAKPMCCRYNGKVFIAYDSNVNRLHVDDGTSIRRVGIGQVAAPTVANQGGGAYPAVARYYRVAMKILDAANTVIASSELGTASTVFTPSGAGLSARITKPATVDSATHWVIYASADDVTYYGLSAYLPVGTTTFDDTQIVGNYPTGPIAPIPGLYVPPSSCKFLGTDGTRLLMAGAHETTAAAGETPVSNKRVWYTRPIGATDIGDDESVTLTAEDRYFIDVDDPEHSHFTAMQVLNGVTYMFFAEAIWRLVPTGIDTIPYRTERVSGAVGAESQLATCLGGTHTGEDAIYFYSPTGGLNRITLSGGLEWLGPDAVPRNPVTNPQNVSLAYDKSRRDLWFMASSGLTGAQVVSIDFLRVVDGVYRGGSTGFSTANAAIKTTVGVSYGGTFYLGGGTATAGLHAFANTGDGSDAGTPVSVQVQMAPFGDGLSNYTAEEPTLQVGNAVSDTVVQVEYWDPFTASGIGTRSVTQTFSSLNGRGMARVSGLVYSDARFLQARLSGSVGTGVVATNFYPFGRVERLFMPYTRQEPL